MSATVSVFTALVISCALVLGSFVTFGQIMSTNAQVAQAVKHAEKRGTQALNGAILRAAIHAEARGA
jgi:hypothetical protein